MHCKICGALPKALARRTWRPSGTAGAVVGTAAAPCYHSQDMATGNPPSALLSIPFGDAAPDDAALLARVAAGSREALADLYQRHAPVLLGLGMRLLSHRRDAEDTLHDVFLEAWRCAADYKPDRAPVRAWLMLRMRSRCLDRLRSADRRRGVSMDGTEDMEPAAAPEANPERMAVRAALDGLPSEQKRVLAMAYYQGCSAREIAERDGIPVGTVKSRTAAGLAKLRTVLMDSLEDTQEKEP